MGQRSLRAVAAVVAVVRLVGGPPGPAAEPRTRLVSTAADGTQANGPSRPHLPIVRSFLSHDGRYIAFRSEATNLAPNNGQVRSRVYRKDMKSGAVLQVDTAINGGDRRDVS